VRSLGIVHHGETEVGDLNMTIGVDEDVELPHSENDFSLPLMTWSYIFQISMYNSLRVQVCHGVGDFKQLHGMSG
jgi:hypothetical protein